MERTDRSGVVPAKSRWSDLGTWDALLDVGQADSAGNVTEGPVEIDHVRNSYVRSDGPLTAVIGVEEVVVVAMNDAVLVGHRDNLPRLKDVVQRMSDGKHKAATEHAVMHRPWGSYQDLDRGHRRNKPRFDAKLGEQIPNMRGGGSRADAQDDRDLRIAFARDDPHQHLGLTSRELGEACRNSVDGNRVRTPLPIEQAPQ